MRTLLAAGAVSAQDWIAPTIRSAESNAGNGQRSISCTACKARPSRCRSSVWSRWSRLGPHRWIGAKHPL